MNPQDKQVERTQGPWRIINTAAGKPAPAGKEMAIVVGLDGRTVADCQTTTSKPLAECQANARLIAAAPTMYSFVASKADSGDAEAMQVIEEIQNASR